MKRIAMLLVGLFSLISMGNATTWFSSEHTCPVCKQNHEYQEIGSYGNYIYQWSSKFQYIYWPLTDSPSVYSCPDCHFSAYMWDFDSIPVNKVDTIKSFLKTVKLEKTYSDYLEIPMTTRLEIAEHVYKILGRDDEFWCQYYRVLGYHYDDKHVSKKALASRQKALEIARRLLADPSNKGQEKEFLFIIAAMHNFTSHSDSSLVYLEKASSLTYKNKNWNKDSAKGLDEYLSGLIIQYKVLLSEEK